tara:strand:+ start:466 stop:1395 length:930 start_codon:yes stop_codon:yes gene_type:complete
MAVRTPLKNDSGNLKQMTSTEVDNIIDQIIYQYSLNPGVELEVVGSGGSVGTVNDTRLQAGAQSTSATSAPSEATTAEPSIVTVSYSKVNETSTAVDAVTDTGTLFPVFLDSSNNIQAMSMQDMLDTFMHPAIDLLTSGSTTTQQAGTYQVATSTSVAGNTLVSSTPIFLDTRADTSLYSAGSIPETQDQPKTITSFYLHRINGTDNSYTLPIYIAGDNHIQEYPETAFETMIQNLIRDVAKNSTNGYSINYTFGGSGASRGSGLVDTRLDGSGNYQTRFVNADDYRAQEFPNGTAQTISTTFLKIAKA